MPNSRNIRKKGKVSFSRYFDEFKEGDHVSIVREPGTVAYFPFRLQGRTGVVTGKRGTAYVVKVKDLNMMKQIMVKPINLKRVLTT